MSRTGPILVALIASFVFSAMAAGSAWAGEWFVGGTKLTGSAALTVEARLSRLIRWLAPGIVAIGCEGPLLLLGAYIHNPALILARRLDFRNCFVLTPESCSIEPTIETQELQGTVKTETSLENRVTYKPVVGKLFATISFQGTGCVIAGETAVDGEVTLGMLNGQTEETTHVFEGLGSRENNSLEIDKEAVYLEGGGALVSLASGSKWSFR
jgi:hypothetical protein